MLDADQITRDCATGFIKQTLHCENDFEIKEFSFGSDVHILAVTASVRIAALATLVIELLVPPFAAPVAEKLHGGQGTYRSKLMRL